MEQDFLLGNQAAACADVLVFHLMRKALQGDLQAIRIILDVIDRTEEYEPSETMDAETIGKAFALIGNHAAVNEETFDADRKSLSTVRTA